MHPNSSMWANIQPKLNDIHSMLRIFKHYNSTQRLASSIL